MGDPREEMPPGETNGATSAKAGAWPRAKLPSERLSRASLRVWRMKRRLLRAIGLDEQNVRVPRYQTVELRMVPTQDRARLEPLVFECPTCTERDGVDTKLLMIEFRTAPKHGRFYRKKDPLELMLLRVTRDQFDRIGADFTKSALASVGRKSGSDRSDREMVLDSLVP